jgi:divalent metal cation (Fe/Co/Zn/Cd) transporter
MASWPVWASLAANAFLFCAKLLVWEQARSLAVAASLLDSTLDLLAQAALAFAAHGAQRPDSRYPVGKARLEASAVVVVSCVFAVGAATVATHCVERLSKGKNAKVPHIQTNDFVLLTLVVVVKLVLFVVCFGFLRRQKKADPQGSLSPALTAITADHAADVLTNAAALLAACLASPPFRLNTHTSRPNTHTTLQRLADPVGGLCISLFVLLGWSWQAWHTICKLVGVRCSREKYDTIKTVIETFREELLCEENLSEALHDDAYLYDAYPPSPKSSVTNPGFAIDTIRAYHGGENVVVEVEIVMPATTMLLEAHVRIARFPNPDTLFAHTRLTLFVHNHRTWGCACS